MKNNIACRIPDSPPTDAVAASIWQLNHKRRHLLLVDRSVSDSRLVGNLGLEPRTSALVEIVGLEPTTASISDWNANHYIISQCS